MSDLKSLWVVMILMTDAFKRKLRMEDRLLDLITNDQRQSRGTRVGHSAFVVCNRIGRSVVGGVVSVVSLDSKVTREAVKCRDDGVQRRTMSEYSTPFVNRRQV